MQSESYNENRKDHLELKHYNNDKFGADEIAFNKERLVWERVPGKLAKSFAKSRPELIVQT